MRKQIFFFFACLIGSSVFAQSEMSVFTATGRGGVATTFVTDYQSIGINPANLGWYLEGQDKKVAFGLIEGGVSLYSEALVKSELKESIKQGDTKFTQAQKRQAAKDFTEAGFTANIDLNLLSFSVQPDEKVGGFAFGIRDRFQWYSEFSEQLSEILFQGYNADYFTHLIMKTVDSQGNPILDSLGIQVLDTILNADDLPQDTLELIQLGYSILPQLFSDILGESRISMSWYREFNFSYGRILMSGDNMSLYGGIGFKYLKGIAIMEIRVADGSLEAYSAISPIFDIDYGAEVKAANPSTIESGGTLPKSVGSGMGIDLGVSLVIGEKLKLGLAVNDIGSITWDGNVYQMEDDSLLDLASSGFDSYNIFVGAQNMLGDSGMFDWSGVVERKVSLPTNIRIGASIRPNEKFEAGLDIIIPVNDVAGSYGKALIGLGVDLAPIPWLRLSTGISSGGNYGFNVPIGLVIIIGEGSWEMGVASRDALTFFSEDRPTISLSGGFLRFRF